MVYTRTAMRFFGGIAENILPYFPDVKTDLKKARMKEAAQEYVSKAILTCFIIFLVELPVLSFVFALVLKSFFFAFISSFTVSIFLTIGFFIIYLNYPKAIIKDRAKKIDANLPFASLYLSTVMGSKLPLYKVLKIFSKFSKYGYLTEEVSNISNDIEAFGIDINTALERAVERTPSKEFKELLWGMLSVNRAGGDMNEYLKEKSKSYFSEYRRRLFEFSHQLTMLIEMYLTVIVIGAIFFTILTSIMSGITGGVSNVIVLQFFLIFVFLPITSAIFIFFVKSTTPGGE